MNVVMRSREWNESLGSEREREEEQGSWRVSSVTHWQNLVRVLEIYALSPFSAIHPNVRFRNEATTGTYDFTRSSLLSGTFGDRSRSRLADLCFFNFAEFSDRIPGTRELDAFSFAVGWSFVSTRCTSRATSMPL